MLTDSMLKRGGGKLETSRYLEELGGFEEYLPPSLYFYAGDRFESIRSRASALFPYGDLMVRGSYIHDLRAFVDVFPTRLGIDTIPKLEKVLQNYDRSFDWKAVKYHCADLGLPFDNKVHKLIQVCTSDILVSLIRHPHSRDVYIGYRHRSNDTAGDHRGYAVLKNGIISQRLDRRLKVNNNEILGLMELLEKVENSGMFPRDISLMIEAGLRPTKFFQAKLFMPFQDPVSMDMPDSSIPHLGSNIPFGITGPEGFETQIRFRPSVNENLPTSFKFKSEEDYGLIVRKQFAVPPMIYDYPFKTLKAYFTDSGRESFLLHQDFRFLQQASVSGCGTIFMLPDSIENKEEFIRQNFNKVRIFSDGKYLSVVPASF